MCDQDSRATGGMMTVTPTIPGGYGSPPSSELEYLLKEIECIIKRNLNEQYLRRILTCLIAYEKII